jgi:lysophospholipid acyltransferase (LPLAT)-like uncharacterized protein
MIPAPFARVAVIVGEPLFVSRSSDDAAIEAHRRVLEQRLAELNRAAHERIAS